MLCHRHLRHAPGHLFLCDSTPTLLYLAGKSPKGLELSLTGAAACPSNLIDPRPDWCLQLAASAERPHDEVHAETAVILG
jgi:hypothetical protein